VDLKSNGGDCGPERNGHALNNAEETKCAPFTSVTISVTKLFKQHIKSMHVKTLDYNREVLHSQICHLSVPGPVESDYQG